MTYATLYLVLLFIALIFYPFTENATIYGWVNLLSDMHLLLCFGIISICSRLEKIIELMERKGDRK